jgi:hypothetical protein
LEAIPSGQGESDPCLAVRGSTGSLHMGEGSSGAAAVCKLTEGGGNLSPVTPVNVKRYDTLLHLVFDLFLF